VRWDDEADYVVVGSGAGGATVAMTFAEAGRSTLVVEEGLWHRRDDFKEDLHSSMATLFRDFGGQVARGRSVIPLLEGCTVGGTTVMNGALVHRLPEAVHAEWCRDAGIGAALPYARIDECAARIEKDLGTRANLAELLPTLPVGHTLARLRWRHAAMTRNAPGCQESGRCLQGCPTGGKMSLEASYVPRAIRAGARLREGQRAREIVLEGGRAVGVSVRDGSGRVARLRARRAVVVSAGVIQSPRLLWASGLRHAHLGKHFQCHPGAGVVGLLPTTMRATVGPPQGVEITQFLDEGIKLATQLLPPELVLGRAAVAGTSLRKLLARADRLSAWTTSVRSRAEGSLSFSRFRAPSVTYTPASEDVERLRRGAWLLAQLLFELGAETVFPCIASAPPALVRDELDAILSASLDPRDYGISVGHMFGTCRMGGQPQSSVVSPRLEVWGARDLYVIDASVLPTTTGLNPQHAIMSIAMLAAQNILATD
jgi:choline dehydrogenase-like flavoprotein